MSTCPFGYSSTDPALDAFTQLYDTFTAGDPANPVLGATAIAASLEALQLIDGQKDDLIILGGQNMVLYHCTTNDGTFSLSDYHIIPFRATDPTAEVSGAFTAMTSISHIFPTLGYLAKALEWETNPSPALQARVQTFYDTITAARTYLTDTTSGDGWFDLKGTSLPAVYLDNKDEIINMGKWMFDETLAFLDSKKGTNYSFTVADVQTYFLPTAISSSGTGTPVEFWGTASVMTSTFCLVVMEIAFNLKNNYLSVLNSIDWSTVKVILSGQTGSLASGVTAATNSTLKVLQFFSEYVLDDKIEIPRRQIFIEPFIALPEGTASTDPAVNVPGWANPTDEASAKFFLRAFAAHWQNLDNRISISETLFQTVGETVGSTGGPDIPALIEDVYATAKSVETQLPIPSPDGSWIDCQLVAQRIAFTMEDYPDTLSDSVASYILDVWNIKGFASEASFVIPGLDYPEFSN